LGEINLTEIEDETFKKFLRRIKKYSETMSESDYLYYHDFYEDAQSVVINKRRPYGATEEQKQEAITTFADVVVRIADYLFAKNGASGETSHTEAGATRQYASADIPEDMTRAVTPFGEAF
jgi:galactokinase/mevalonate kinase-like predicted kinase